MQGTQQLRRVLVPAIPEVAIEELVVPEVRRCPGCQQPWGAGRACQACRQVDGLPIGLKLSSPRKRLLALVLDAFLFVVTLGLGHLVWSLVVYGRGQNPAKQVLGMRVVNLHTRTHVSWKRMFVREWLAKLVVLLLGVITFGTIYLWVIWDRDNQELWDKALGTVVVDDPNNQLG